jgi:two-component sensor histidine kinase
LPGEANIESLTRFFGTAGFVPHGFCILWRPDILALHVISDLIIAASYFSIPLAIFAFVRRRTDLMPEHRRVAVLFSVFILGCGVTHIMGVVVLWYPAYGLDGLIKGFTAFASIVTAIALWPLLPRLLKIPSPITLAAANERLQDEITARLAAHEALQAIRASLEDEVVRRTREVQALARRFEIATSGSVITVSEQDEALRYTWLHNPLPPFSDRALGRSDVETLQPAAAAALVPLKQRVLQSGEALRADVALAVAETTRHFDIQITPSEVDGGGAGLLVASVDITEQVRQQEQLQFLMRELAHRAKNLLSLVEGVARQTAKAEGLPDAFANRFGERLRALADAHDLLLSNDWHGLDLETLVRSQIAHLLPEAGERVEIGGPPVRLESQPAQYLALAMHELATNAAKYGVLSRAEGWLIIAWRRIGPPNEPRVELTWTETGAEVAAPSHAGFGRQLLERLVPRALGGEASFSFGREGLVWRIDFKA